jgi:hypothetical protein
MAKDNLVLGLITICHLDGAATEKTSSSNRSLAVNLFLPRMIRDAASRYGVCEWKQTVMDRGEDLKGTSEFSHLVTC